MPPELPRIVVGFLLALLLAIRGRRKKSLSTNGSIAAFLVGFLSCASSIRFGITLCAFYLSATRATKYKAHLKSKIEDGFTFQAGNRTAKQVLSSSLPAIFICLTYAYLFRYDTPIIPTFIMRSSLNLSYLLFFAACNGDTFASEIGIAMPGPGKNPVLCLMPWKRVPRGTNGGITIEGTLASAFGGLIVGFASFLANPEWSFSQLYLIIVGIVGGVIGSFLDSVIGMFLQASWLDKTSGKVLKHAPSKLNQQHDNLQHICGRDLLSGESVNALAAILTAAMAPLFLPLFKQSYSQL